MTCFPTLNQDLGPDFLQSRRESFTHALLFEEFLHFLLGGIVLMQELLDKNDFFCPSRPMNCGDSLITSSMPTHRRERPKSASSPRSKNSNSLPS